MAVGGKHKRGGQEEAEEEEDEEGQKTKDVNKRGAGNLIVSREPTRQRYAYGPSRSIVIFVLFGL